MAIKRAFIYILLLCFTCQPVFAGTAHYCDLSSPGTISGDGSWGNPFVSLSAVNNHSFETGDDVYFLRGVPYILASNSDNLQIDHGGTAGDRAIFGCYWNDGGSPNTDCGAVPGVDGNRPIFDGDNGHPATKAPDPYNCEDGSNYGWVGIIHVASAVDYVTVRELKVQHSTGHGIQFQGYGSNEIIVDNCYAYDLWRQGISFAYVEGGEIKNNYVDTAAVQPCVGDVGIQVTAMFHASGPNGGANVEVSDNWVTGSYEGIGFYKGANQNTAQRNRVWNNESYQVYIGTGSHSNTIRWNTIWYTTGWSHGSNDRGIHMGCESWACSNALSDSGKCSDDNLIYGNFLANNYHSISFDSNCEGSSLWNEGNLVYHNTSVDPVSHTFHFTRPGGFDDNIFKDNISWTGINNSGNHTNVCSPSNTAWSHNLYSDSPGSGYCDDNYIVNTPELEETAWASITSSLSTNDFRLSSANAPGYMTGTALGSPYNVDFWSNTHPSPPNIGADGQSFDAPDMIPTSSIVPSGFSGTSRDFESSDTEELSHGDGLSTDVTGSGLTILAQVCPEDDTADNMYIVSKWDNVAGSRQYALIYNDSANAYQCLISNDGTNYDRAEGATGITYGSYQHVACVFNGSTITLYVNGYEDTNPPENPRSYTATIYDGNESFRIGSEDGEKYFDGLIDEVGVFDRAFSATEILQAYTFGLSGNTGGSDIVTLPVSSKGMSYWGMQRN